MKRSSSLPTVTGLHHDLGKLALLLLSIVRHHTVAAAGDCFIAKQECNDAGICQEVLLPCDNCPGGMKLCEDGICRDLDEPCVFSCSEEERECPERQCIPTNSRCCKARTIYDIYYKLRNSGHCPVCRVNQRRCPNGECINPGEFCFSPCPENYVTCPNGWCAETFKYCDCNKFANDGDVRYVSDRCNDCPNPETHKRCENWECVEHGIYCSPCPQGTTACDHDGYCYPHDEVEEKCPPCRPGMVECEDGRCEWSMSKCVCGITEDLCPDGSCAAYAGQCPSEHESEMSMVYLIIPIVFVMLGALLAIAVAKHSLNKEHKKAEGRDPRTGKTITVKVARDEPSHFPIPLVPLEHRMQVTGPPPPVWHPGDDTVCIVQEFHPSQIQQQQQQQEQLQREQLQQEPLQQEQLQREQLQREQLQREQLQREPLQREQLQWEQLQREQLQREQHTQQQQQDCVIEPIESSKLLE